MNIPSRKTSAIHRLPDSAGLLLLGVLCLGLITCICASTVQGGEAREMGASGQSPVITKRGLCFSFAVTRGYQEMKPT